MKIYFGGSIKGGRQDADIYAQIIKEVKKYGEVITEYVGSSALTDKGEEGLDAAHIYKRDMQWLDAADVVIAEVTQPSLGVGYEIGRAERNKTPMLCLFRPSAGKQLSSIIAGNGSVKVVSYEIEKIPEILKTFFSQYHGK